METSHMAWYSQTIKQYLTRQEVDALMQKSDWRAVLELATTWGWIAAAFALAGFFPNPFTILIALIILGGKQLACAIIMHDCSHNAYFTSARWNTLAGNWFGSYPIIQNVDQYRSYHLQHHKFAGLHDDPDLSLTKGYPTTAMSMARKFARDLSGATGIKGQLAVLTMHAGYLSYSLGGAAQWLQKRSFAAHLQLAWQNLRGPVAANLILFGVLWTCGAGWLYLLWTGALLTTYNVSLRVRSMAEHSVVEERENPHKNTRTTYANFLERMLFAPHHVNYHAEHHLMMAAPPYNYPKLHRLLLARGYFDEGVLETGYWNILKKAVVGKL